MKLFLIFTLVSGMHCYGQSTIPQCLLTKEAFYNVFDIVPDALIKNVKDLVPTHANGKRTPKVSYISFIGPQFDSMSQFVSILTTEHDNQSWFQLSSKDGSFEIIKSNNQGKKKRFSRISSSNHNKILFRRRLTKIRSILSTCGIDCEE
jgi:hypothetical protein